MTAAVVQLHPDHAEAPTPLAARLLTPSMVCQLYPGLTEAKLKHLRAAQTGPAYFQPTDRTVMYDPDEIAAWIARSRVTPKRI